MNHTEERLKSRPITPKQSPRPTARIPMNDQG